MCCSSGRDSWRWREKGHSECDRTNVIAVPYRISTSMQLQLLNTFFSDLLQLCVLVHLSIRQHCDLTKSILFLCLFLFSACNRQLLTSPNHSSSGMTSFFSLTSSHTFLAPRASN